MTLLLDRSSLVDRFVIQTGSWEPHQLNLIRAAINYFKDPELYFLDIGAYWGLYSLIAYAAGVKNIIAFEADSCNYSQLQAQFFLNNVSTRIKAHNLAVSDSIGVVSVADSQHILGGNRGGTGIVNAGAPNTFQINSITIDKFISINNFIIVCKIDVEGHEAQVLNGMRDTIRNNKVLLQIEIFDQFYDRIVQILKDLNLRLLHKISVDHYYTNIDDQSLFERLIGHMPTSGL